jgi:hypothetical protein
MIKREGLTPLFNAILYILIFYQRVLQSRT